jgi:hypothetical protein
MRVPGRWLRYAAVLLTACVGPDTGQRSGGEVGETELSSGSCGVERWSIKTGSDSAVGQVNMTPQDTTIAALIAIPVPAGFSSSSPRFTYAGSPEIQNYRLTNVTLTQYKMENDSDYHLILQDSAGHTLIAEIPYPGCLTGSSWTTQVTNSRNAFDAKYAVSTSFQTANDTVTVTGVGFFDVLHGQTGVAPNGIELHSVLSICWGTNCAGGATPDFSISASPASVTGAGTSTVTVGAINGFTGTVSLSASGAPTGASATLSPASVAGSGTSTLTLSPGSAAAGTYPITVNGTSGSLTHTAGVSWTIQGSSSSGPTNPGFESGLTGWTSSGSTSVSTTAHSGAQSAMVGSTSPTTDSSLSQTFTLPANAAGVSFWYQVHCPDTITYDWASATLKDNATGTTTTMLAKTCTNSGTWQQASASATGGHSVTLTLSNHDDNYASDPTYTLYDDVAVATGSPDTTPPTTSVTAPAAGSTVSGTVTVTATASDNVGVTKIELYVDGTLLGSGTSSPFSAAWNTAGAANGAHSLTSKAYDAAGNVGTSSAVPVTVSNGAVTNPVVNPGFETGTLSGWTATGVARASPYPHTGSYAGSLGSSSPSTDSTLSQTFTMPAGANTLTLWYRIFCFDTITYDWASATLTDNTTNTTIIVLPNTCTNTNTWVQASASATSMRGHSVTLTLLNHDDNYPGDATYTDFDDISVQ